MACYAGFSPSSSPRVDVVRLGIACGPSTGLVQRDRTSGIVDEAGRTVSLGWDAARGDCFRLFAVAGTPVEDLEVELKAPGAAATDDAVTNQNRRWLVVGEDGPFCAKRAGHYEATFSTHSGSAPVSAAVWRGAHMIDKRHPLPPGAGPDGR